MNFNTPELDKHEELMEDLQALALHLQVVFVKHGINNPPVCDSEIVGELKDILAEETSHE